MESIEIWICPDCSSPRVEEQCWVTVNTAEPIETIDGEYWCPDCDNHVPKLKLKENNAN
tara:strand:- start:6312 stop:6488 length:177 start_codon:yes stop_codon:yes gene_type:complete